MTAERIPFADYLAREALSASGAKDILRAPAAYRWKRDNPTESTTAQAFGTVVHSLVFPDGAADVEVVDESSWQSKAAKEAKAAALAAGMTPILCKDYEQAEECAQAVRSHPMVRSLLRDGQSERSWFADLDGTPHKARTDWLTRVGGELVICDLKTTRSAEPGQFRRSVADFGYHVQDAVHRRVVEAVLGEPVGMLFIAAEKEPPYLVSVVELDDASKARGEELADRAALIYAECLRTGEWPGYPQTVNRISLPQWAMYDEEHDND